MEYNIFLRNNNGIIEESKYYHNNNIKPKEDIILYLEYVRKMIDDDNNIEIVVLDLNDEEYIIDFETLIRVSHIVRILFVDNLNSTAPEIYNRIHIPNRTLNLKDGYKTKFNWSLSDNKITIIQGENLIPKIFLYNTMLHLLCSEDNIISEMEDLISQIYDQDVWYNISNIYIELLNGSVVEYDINDFMKYFSKLTYLEE